MAYATAAEIINRVARQVGIAPVASPYGSTNPAFVQLTEFLTTAGDDLLRRHDWGHLAKEYSWTTTASQATQALPADFHKMLPRTLWDRTSQEPGDGPVDAKETQYLIATSPASVGSVVYRQQGTNLTFPVVLSAGLDVAFEYLSTYWVQSNGQTSGDKAAPTQDDDTVLFDPLMVVRLVKVLWKNAKGMDASIDAMEFEQTLDSAKAMNTGSRKVSLAGKRKGFRFLSGLNIPDTGYGVP